MLLQKKQTKSWKNSLGRKTNKRYIYTVVSFRISADNSYMMNERVWGWHRDLKSAENYIKHGLDYEYCYSHALIERIPEVWGIADIIAVYKCVDFDKNLSVKIKELDCLKQICNVSMG